MEFQFESPSFWYVKENYRNVPGTNEKLLCVIIGDEAFPLDNYLLRPYPEPQIARKVVEDAFNQLTAKFHSSGIHTSEVADTTSLNKEIVHKGNLYIMINIVVDGRDWNLLNLSVSVPVPVLQK
ncbi:protein ALP1-like [Aphis craccivora]|uniref:Protein ALP1-like n=1 Tax=Aphis craccivora TaxID=307492 RepID=A0A6G0VWT7_APHCR|nr:protein ALP1-like [Aphis craccivora]